jgi:Xaa-Pro aminopeptidase
MAQLSPGAAVEDITADVRFLRMIKSEAEIAVHTRAGVLASKMTDVIREKLSDGITELEMSAYIEHAFRLSGNGVITSKQEGLVLASGVCSAGVNTLAGNKFDGICSGMGVSPALPFGASFDVIPQNTPVLFDFGFVLDGYHVDITRMASLGKPAQRVLDAFNVMCDIEKAVVALLKPGNTWESTYERALEMAGKSGLGDEFMGLGKEKVRFVGHGVGIQLDEPPFLAAKMPMRLAANMVVAIEPKVSIPDVGVVGIENTYVIREHGAELLTTAPEEFIII